MFIFSNSPSQNLFDYFSFYKPLEDPLINDIHTIVSNLEFIEGKIGTDLIDYRKSKIKWIEYNNFSKELYKHLESLANLANQQHYNFDLYYSNDDIQYTEYYGSNKGKYDWHIDHSPGIYNNRKLSLVIQLSDPSEYEGGELQIQNYNTKNTISTIPKQKGLITIFPSYLLHRVTPITKGTRKSLVWWVGGSQFS